MYGTEWVMSTILDPLVERLRALPASMLETVAVEAGVFPSLPRKLASRDRTNPTIETIEPLLDYFARVDAGVAAIPDKPHSAKVIQAQSARLRALKKRKGHTANAPRKADRHRCAPG